MIDLKYNNVLVRSFEEKDIENKIMWINDFENNRYLHYDIPLSYDKTLEWFRKKADNRLDCIIEYDGVPVGVIGILGIDKVHCKAEFYITIGNTRYKRRGIAYIASNLLLTYAFEKLNLNKVFLNVDEENHAACRLYEKLGFELEGRFEKDLFHRGEFINRCRYAILKECFSGGLM